MQPNTCILSFSSPLISLESAGGKGLHLAEMVREGFQVPPGFIVDTDAYLTFVRENRLDSVIEKCLKGHVEPDAAALEEMAKVIHSAFNGGKISTSLQAELITAYDELDAGAVAVRSSATAEDLPDLSFAGQQDTYLNVTGKEMLLTRVIDCWSSLWTARAIGYRLRQGVSRENIALAVVVQTMVQSEVSGVLFTANPLTGSRVETVIDATFGLGEALVSGLVEPDHYVVDTCKNSILQKHLGRKAVSIRAVGSGGVEKVEEDAKGLQALTDDRILQLSQTGTRVQQAFGEPQDIEWAYCGEQLYLLQTRPITSLFPLPAGMPVEPLKTLVSFAAVQGMVDPLTPIGASVLKTLFALGSQLFGVKTTESKQTVLYSAGERLWINFTPIVRNTFGRKLLPYIFGMVEPTVKQAVDQIIDDPGLQPEHKGVSLRARSQMALFFIPLAANVFLNVLSPARRREMIVRQGETILERMDGIASAVDGDRRERLSRLVDLLPEIANKVLGRALILFVSGIASGVASWNALRAITRGVDGDKARWNDLLMEVTRGMPNNPTTEMDLRLWEMSKRIKPDAGAVKTLREVSPVVLTRRYLDGKLPAAIQNEVGRFLSRYGGRGFCEIDLGRTRWAEDPVHVFEMLTNFIKIEDANDAPDAVFARGKVSAEAAVDQLAALVRRVPGGFIKARVLRFFAGRARQLMGLRESPKFFAVRMMWIIHREIKKTGLEFVDAGELEQAEDLFYLSFAELKAFAAREPRDWKKLIAERRQLFEREKGRRQLPRLLLSDGRAFYEGMAEKAVSGKNMVAGSPVSPGIVEGRVRVVRDPGRAGLMPGEIMVCPGTDPSWTPLFLVAGGLIMEIGGMMTHGAVVAREYGIPAVVGVDQATMRLVTGQRIRLNGSTGEITLLD